MTQQYFDDVAGEWDEMREGFFPDGLRDEAAEAMRVKPDGRYLDVGAGTGFLVAAILQRGARASAVDASPRMVELLRARFPLVDARVADAERLPFADATFEGAFANMCLHHVERPEVALREMARVTKPGGRVVVTDLDRHDHEFLRVEHKDRWMGFAREDVAAWLEAAGLREVEVGCAGGGCCAQSACGTQRAEVGIFLAVGVRA